MDDGHLGKCKECACKDVRENRKKREEFYNNFDRNRYRNNIRRMMVLKYNSMRRRINGLNLHSNLLGKELLSKEDFIKWAFGEGKKSFMKLYKVWVKNDFPRKLSPSIDRIDNNKGYVLGNLQWLTQSDNVKKYYDKSNYQKSNKTA